MSFNAMRSAALAATFLAGSAMMAHAQTSSTIGTGGSTAGSGSVGIRGVIRGNAVVQEAYLGTIAA